VAVVDFHSANARGIVDRGVLVALDGLAVFAFEFQELDADLDLMTWHLLLVSLSVDLANTRAAGQPAEAVAPENAIHAGFGDGNGVITRQVPDDAYRPQAVGRAQVQNLLDDLRGGTIGGILRRRFAVLEASPKWLPDVLVDWGDVWLGAFLTALFFEIGKVAIRFYIGKQRIDLWGSGVDRGGLDLGLRNAQRLLASAEKRTEREPNLAS
jgi:hypothetical protein